MRKCRRCKKEPVGYNQPRSLCSNCGKEYKRRREEERKKWQLLPDCQSRITRDCDGKVDPRRAAEGKVSCNVCWKLISEQEREDEAEVGYQTFAQAGRVLIKC